ncbi:MAG: bifunctional diaminohydroxyphosphoribosylaminopyrimidine deaminase/5-amino-6-(5-phosphoribosylamino)uracil reductase RibD [Gammaproteobacteria bacterium]
MARALRLARRGLYGADPNPRVGCVLVRDGEIVGEGWHERAGGPHAEVHALAQAGERACGATAYVTLEPCCHHGRTPPCADALVAAGVARVVAAMVDPNPKVGGAGLARLVAAGIAVESGLMQAEAEALNPGFIMRMRLGQPFVRCKLAMSLDGRTAMANGESKWITSGAARHDVHHLRARSSAIMTGVGTVLADDPALTARLDDERIRQPLRVVLDTHLRTPPQARLLDAPGRALIVTASRNQVLHDRLARDNVTVVTLPEQINGIDLPAVMRHLAALEVNEVLLEAGPTLSGAMLRAGLIDELIIYMAPHLMGDAARGLFHLPELVGMDQRIAMDIIDIRAVGKDWRITAKVVGDS